METKIIDNPETKTNFPEIPAASILKYMGYVCGDELRTCPKAHKVIGWAMQRARLGVPALIWCFATDFKPGNDAVEFERQILSGINDIISDHMRVDEEEIQANPTITRVPAEIIYNVEVRFSRNVCFEVLVVRYERPSARECWS